MFRWIKTRLLAVVGRSQMGATEAVVLVVTFGAIVLATLPLKPESTGGWQYYLWLVVVVGASLLVLRGGYGILRLVLAEARNRLDPIVGSLPLELRSPVSRRTKATIPADPPLGFLDFEAAALRAMARMTQTLERMTSESAAVAADLTFYTPRFGAVASASIDRKVALSREFAAKLNRHAARFEEREAALRTNSEAMATNYLRRIESFEPDADLDTLRPQIARMRDVTTESRGSVSGYRAALVNMRSQNIQQSINEALDRLILTATKVVSDFDRTVRFATDALAVIDDKIAARPPADPVVTEPPPDAPATESGSVTS